MVDVIPTIYLNNNMNNVLLSLLNLIENNKKIYEFHNKKIILLDNNRYISSLE